MGKLISDALKDSEQDFNEGTGYGDIQRARMLWTNTLRKSV